jgi:hypothetical protein
MKKILVTFTSLTLLFSCEPKEQEQKSEFTNQKTEVTKESYTVIHNEFASFYLNEVRIKGHLYLYTTVRDGISITHAGHCNHTHQ